jgi:phage virion morphogenesis protein
MKITLNTEWLKKVYNNLVSMNGNFNLYSSIGNYMMASVEENFQREGRPNTWEKLSDATLAKKGPGRKILQESNFLRQSMGFQAFADKVQLGTNLVYAAIQHFGGYAGRNKEVYIPARPYLLVHTDDEKEINDIVDKEIWR